MSNDKLREALDAVQWLEGFVELMQCNVEPARTHFNNLREAIAASKPEPQAPYGYCPICGAKGEMRERRPVGGKDVCANGHEYLSADAKPEPQAQAGEDSNENA